MEFKSQVMYRNEVETRSYRGLLVTHLSRIEFPTLNINWTSQIPLLDGICHFYSNFNIILYLRIKETQQTLRVIVSIQYDASF